MKPVNPLEYSFFFNKKIYSNSPNSPISLLTDQIFNQLNTSSRNIDIRKLSLNNILSNLLIGYKHGRYIVISKSANTYSNYTWYGFSHYTFRLIVEWINALLNEGYINQSIGFYDSKKGKGKRSRISATEKLISMSKEKINRNIESFSSLHYSRNIILKDEGLMRYKPSGKVIKKIKFLDEYNDFIETAQIIFPFNPNSFFFPRSLSSLNSVISSYHLLSTGEGTDGSSEHPATPLLITTDTKSLLYKEISGKLYRVFNQKKFTRGGRFYGSFYQQLSEQDRTKILINGSSIVERDYSAFHLNMLYHLNGKQFSEDPYSAVDRPELRDILKALCLIVINSDNPTQALRALIDVIRKNWEFRNLKRIYQFDEKELLRKFENVHSEISKYFCSGIGLELMYRDSEIAESILKHFTRREIPCLCVHDSFPVPAQHQDELREVMIAVYKRNLGFDPKLK